MTDQLRQALTRFWVGEEGRDDRVAMMTAVQAWLEFPTDAQVEAAAEAMYGADDTYKEAWEYQEDDVRNWYRRVTRVALEAVRHHTNGEEPQ